MAADNEGKKQHMTDADKKGEKENQEKEIKKLMEEFKTGQGPSDEDLDDKGFRFKIIPEKRKKKDRDNS